MPLSLPFVFGAHQVRFFFFLKVFETVGMSCLKVCDDAFVLEGADVAIWPLRVILK